MYKVMDASAVTVILVMAAMLTAPFYILWTYVASGASARKGALIGAALGAWGAVMTWFCLADVAASMGPLGRLVVPACWATPTVILLLFRDWFLDRPLSQRWLVGLQAWRVIGAVFLIEMARGNLPGIFAIPAGVGDVIEGVLAIGVLLAYRNKPAIGRTAVAAVIAVGLTDLAGAFFFAFTSTAGPQQLFHPAVANQPLLFPTGMIPLFLVPGLIFYHTLSLLNLRRTSNAKVRKMTEGTGFGAAGAAAV